MASSGMVLKARLNLKIDSDLKDWAKDYARRRGVDITKLLCEYLIYLREQEKKQVDMVEQI